MNKEKLQYFIEHESKNSFAQNPYNWFLNNDYGEFIHLIERNDLVQTKKNLFEFVYGLPVCSVCGKPHRNLIAVSGWRGWAKTCSAECLGVLRSDRMCGENNAVHKLTNEGRKNMGVKVGLALQKKILSGEYTPKSENYRIHNMIHYKRDNVTYKIRSSWELIFFILNPNIKYETLRIKYYDSLLDKDRIYIVDFFDSETNTVIEVKPKAHLYTFKDKQQEVERLGYTLRLISDDFINDFKRDSVKRTFVFNEIKQNCLDFNIHQNRLKWIDPASVIAE